MAAMEQRALRLYSAAELAEATAGFSQHTLIGTGGFGNVYRAMVHLSPVAIKLLDDEGLQVCRPACGFVLSSIITLHHLLHDGQGLREMETEMTLLASLHHRWLVECHSVTWGGTS